ncbi:MAG: chemotaxis protein CheC [Oscillospiraceae bacterium]|jgi:chemotaxis protein CheC|nr:chemotaxis protein CheC [Oscillospiraceae bacterium]
MLEKYEDLNEMHLDVLKEIGNIGSGNASTALSAMIGREIAIHMPSIKILGFQEAIENNGSPEDIVAAVLVRLKGEVSGMILLLVEQEFAENVLNVFFGEKDIDLLKLNENDVSALTEIGNIMGSAYVSAIAQLTGLEIGVETPSFAVDMLGAIMSVPVIEFGEVSDKLLCIDKTIEIDGVSMKSNMMLIPTVDSLSNLFGKLGVDA